MYNDTKILKRILTVGDKEQLHFFFLTSTKSGKSAVFCQKCFERDLLLKYKLFSQTLYCSLSVEALWKASWKWLSMLGFYHYHSTNLEMLTKEQMTELCTFVFAQWPPRSVWLLYAGDEILTKNGYCKLQEFQFATFLNVFKPFNPAPGMLYVSDLVRECKVTFQQEGGNLYLVALDLNFKKALLVS